MSAVKIKPLVWVAASHESCELDIVAHSKIGKFYATCNANGGWISWYGTDRIGLHLGRDQARRRCEEEYERRVRECLE